MAMRIFLAGIIQGSQPGTRIHDQAYRQRLKSILESALPAAQVYCPLENHPNSIGYALDRAQPVFFGHVDRAAQSEVIVAYLPEASMGTAIEIWEAYRRGRIIFVISPLTENWVIKLLATRHFATLGEFETFVQSGQLRQFLDDHAQTRR